MKKIAYIFPGQGAQIVGMGKDFFDTFVIAKKTFEEADDLLKMDLSKGIFEGPTELLTLTKNAQLSIFVNSMAITRVLHEEFPEMTPLFCSGLSLGEYSALCASGKLSFHESLALIQKRADLMNAACTKNPGTMAAVLGLNALDVDESLKGIDGVWIANYNCPGQIVISGTKEGVEKGSAALKEKGAKRVLPLSVSGAFHSPLMQDAQDALMPFIMASSLQKTPVELVMNVSGISENEKILENLTSQVTGSVRWEQGIRYMDERGVALYLEIGCGKTLSGMNRKIGVSGKTLSLEKVSDLKMVGEQQ